MMDYVLELNEGCQGVFIGCGMQLCIGYRLSVDPLAGTPISGPAVPKAPIAGPAVPWHPSSKT